MAAEKSGHDSEVWISSIEHPSVREACAHYWGPARVIQMPVSRNGALDLDWLADRLKTERPALVCLMAVNNETGVIQPVDTVLDLCQSRGIPLYCDAVQWFGKGAGPLAQHMEGLSFSLSAHKFGGLKGTGCLVLGQQWSGSKFQYGGGQESGARGGTEDVPGIAAMATALSNRLQPLNSSAKAARDAFEEQLAALWPDVVIHGKATARVWNTSYVSLPQFHANRWISRLDRKGFEVSSGAACSSSNGSTSAVLRAMCVADAVAARAVRISAGWETAPGKWAGLLVALEEVRQELGKAGQHSGPGTVIEI